MAMTIREQVQSLLTQGLDAATQIKLAELRVNDPTGYVTGPNGQRVQQGQQAGLSGALAGIPPIVWLGLVVAIGAVVLGPLLKR